MLRLMAYSASRPHDEDFSMQAHEFMTKEPVTVSPDTPTPEIARLLLAHKISAAPVVDDAGTPIGMVSEGDLLGRGDADREGRRDWWLMLLAEGEALHPDFLATLRNPQLTAREVMSAPVIRIPKQPRLRKSPASSRNIGSSEFRSCTTIASSELSAVPICFALLRRSTRRNAVRSIAPSGRGWSARSFVRSMPALATRTLPWPRETLPTAAEAGLTVTDFHALATDFAHHNVEHQEEARRSAAEQRQPASEISSIITSAMKAGARPCTMLARRPRAARKSRCCCCSRLIFAPTVAEPSTRPSPDWPRTLRGEAAEIYLRWNAI
jgi:hypothetical protein